MTEFKILREAKARKKNGFVFRCKSKILSAVSNESIDFAVFRILQEERKTTGA